MKITRRQLRRLIKEELSRVMEQTGVDTVEPGSVRYAGNLAIARVEADTEFAAIFEAGPMIWPGGDLLGKNPEWVSKVSEGLWDVAYTYYV